MKTTPGIVVDATEVQLTFHNSFASSKITIQPMKHTTLL